MTNSRHFHVIIFLVSVQLFISCNQEEPKSTEYYMYISSGNNQDNFGIGVYKWIPKLKKATLVYNDSSLAMSSYLEIDTLNATLYAVGESGISAHKINPKTGKLSILNKVENVGRGPCHVSVDPTRGLLYVSYYGSGSFAVFEIKENGEVGPLLDSKFHVGLSANLERQESPHVHMALPVPQSDLILVLDLGIDKVKVYEVSQKGKLRDVGLENTAVMSPGDGPRHAVIHPTRKFVYVLNEIKGRVVGFEFDPSHGFTKQIGVWNSAEEGFDGYNKSADIHVSKDGRFLYSSNRGPNDIGIFSIDNVTGKLNKITNLDCGGDWPRAFSIDPSGRFLIIANKNSNQLSMMEIDRQSGQFEKVAEINTLLSPQAIRFIKVQ